MMVFVFTEVCIHSKVHIAQDSVQHLYRDSSGVDFLFSGPLDLTWGWASVLFASVNTSNNGSDGVRNMVNHVMKMYINFYQRGLVALSWPEI